MKINLVEDWRAAWKWYSMWGGMLILALSGAMEILPVVQELVSPVAYHYAMMALATVVLVGRLLAQVQAVKPNGPVA